MKRLSLSFPDDLLEEADKLASKMGKSRSGFVQAVLVDYLKAQKRRALEKRLAEEYREMARESLAQSRAFAAVEDESLERQLDGAGDGLDW